MHIHVGASVDTHVDAGTGNILMDDVACSGSELRLIDCEHVPNPNCFHFEDVGIKCNNSGQNLSCVVIVKLLKFHSTAKTLYPLTCVRILVPYLPALLSLLVYMVCHMTTSGYCWHAPNPYNQYTCTGIQRRHYKAARI